MSNVTGQSERKPPTRRELVSLLQRAADEIACTEAGRNSVLLRDIHDALKREPRKSSGTEWHEVRS